MWSGINGAETNITCGSWKGEYYREGKTSNKFEHILRFKGKPSVITS